MKRALCLMAVVLALAMAANAYAVAPAKEMKMAKETAITPAMQQTAPTMMMTVAAAPAAKAVQMKPAADVLAKVDVATTLKKTADVKDIIGVTGYLATAQEAATGTMITENAKTVGAVGYLAKEEAKTASTRAPATIDSAVAGMAMINAIPRTAEEGWAVTYATVSAVVTFAQA